MTAPPEIVGLLESVVGVYLSDVRHRERAAFILCDALIEAACKYRALEVNYSFDTRAKFKELLKAPGVKLSDNALGGRVFARHKMRNEMQHQSAAATVDPEYCADAILDAVTVIDRFWPDSSGHAFKAATTCGLRVIRLYSGSATPATRYNFEREIGRCRWELDRRAPRVTEAVFQPGHRQAWLWAVTTRTEVVEEVLNSVGAT